MPASPQDILEAFDSLSLTDQRFVADEIIRRMSPWGVEAIDDSSLAHLADEVFRSLDAQEEA